MSPNEIMSSMEHVISRWIQFCIQSGKKKAKKKKKQHKKLIFPRAIYVDGSSYTVTRTLTLVLCMSPRAEHT